MSTSVAWHLRFHQPYHVKQYTIFDAAHDHQYFNDEGNGALHNRQMFLQATDASYRPLLTHVQRALETHAGFRLSLSVSGSFLEQAEAWAPDIIETLQTIVMTGRVELLAEPYHHSLAFLYSASEFERQVALHKTYLQRLFQVVPKVFCNTEMVYSDALANWAERRGYVGVVADGHESVLGWRSANHMYQAAGTKQLKLLLRNQQLSNDIALRFSDTTWGEWPLTAHKFAKWVQHDSSGSRLTYLSLDARTFGMWHPAHDGIFNFFDHFITMWLKNPAHDFLTISGAMQQLSAEDAISVPAMTAIAGANHGLDTWVGSELQKEAIRYAYGLEADILQTEDESLLRDWRRLLEADLLRYMDTDQPLSRDDNPYGSPYDAFLTYMNIVRDVRWRIMQYRRGL